jgi:VanZ family protein
VWPWAYAPVLFWVGVIFFLSSPNGASTETSRFIRPIIEFFFPDASSGVFEAVHFVVRKTAHLSEYAVLAILAFRAARLSGGSNIGRHYLLIPFVLVGVIAILDEFNQSFEPSRTSSPWDSVLDCVGGVLALTACWLVIRRERR